MDTIREYSFGALHTEGNQVHSQCVRESIVYGSIIVNQQRLAYIKVYVDVTASMNIPCSIEVELRNGNSVTVNVEIPWMLVKCSQCRIFGHGDNFCPMKKLVTQAWIQKKVDKKADEVVPVANTYSIGE